MYTTNGSPTGRLSIHAPTPLDGPHAVTSLDGLDALEIVVLDLVIQDHDRLVDIDALSELQTVGGNLTVRNHAALCQATVEDLVADISVAGVTTLSANDGVCE